MDIEDRKGYDLCPYCHECQIGVEEDDDLYRCAGCNFWVRRSILVDDPLDHVLNDEQEAWCPWCAYPVASEQSYAEDVEFLCKGCSGTLIHSMLVTQADLVRQRARYASSYGYLVLAAFAVLAAVIAMAFILGD